MARPAKDKPVEETIVESAAVNEPEIEIVKETPAVQATSEPPDDGIARLKEQLAQERAGRERAERERNEATQREFRANVEKDETEVRLYDGAVAQIKANNAELKQRWAMAMSANDFSAAADFQEMIADNTAKMVNIEAGKQSLKERPKQQPRVLDPVEAFIQQNNIGSGSARWLRDHPECVTDPKLTRRMVNAARDAEEDGLEVHSQAYLDYVENRLGFSNAPAQGHIEEPLSQAAAPSQRRSSPPAAPVSRDISPSGQKARMIRLTAEEAEMARLTGQTPQEYYANKHRDSVH